VRTADGLLRTPDNAAYPFTRGSSLCGFERLPAVQAISRRGGHAWIRTGIADGVREAGCGSGGGGGNDGGGGSGGGSGGAGGNQSSANCNTLFYGTFPLECITPVSPAGYYCCSTAGEGGKRRAIRRRHGSFLSDGQHDRAKVLSHGDVATERDGSGRWRTACF
jgi:hypothetical protein